MEKGEASSAPPALFAACVVWLAACGLCAALDAEILDAEAKGEPANDPKAM
jgi:hypothetical protein